MFWKLEFFNAFGIRHAQLRSMKLVIESKFARVEVKKPCTIFALEDAVVLHEAWREGEQQRPQYSATGDGGHP